MNNNLLQKSMHITLYINYYEGKRSKSGNPPPSWSVSIKTWRSSPLSGQLRHSPSSAFWVFSGGFSWWDTSRIPLLETSNRHAWATSTGFFDFQLLNLSLSIQPGGGAHFSRLDIRFYLSQGPERHDVVHLSTYPRRGRHSYLHAICFD